MIGLNWVWMKFFGRKKIRGICILSKNEMNKSVLKRFYDSRFEFLKFHVFLTVEKNLCLIQ